MSDYLQGVVWRVPPGGGEAGVWLSDRRLDGGEFGTTGLALAADRRTLLIAQGSSAGLGEPNPTTGKIYATEIQPDGSPGRLRQLWESGPADLPDGFAIARSGKLYVPLAGAANQIAVVAPDGTELERFPSAPGDGDNGSPVPFDTPSSARFLGTRLIVANQSFTGNRDNQALLDVETGEPGLPELIPGLDHDPPTLSRVSLSRKRVRAGGRGRERVRFSVSERSTRELPGRAARGRALARGEELHAQAQRRARLAGLQDPRPARWPPPRGGARPGRRRATAPRASSAASAPCRDRLAPGRRSLYVNAPARWHRSGDRSPALARPRGAARPAWGGRWR